MQVDRSDDDDCERDGDKSHDAYCGDRLEPSILLSHSYHGSVVDENENGEDRTQGPSFRDFASPRVLRGRRKG